MNNKVVKIIYPKKSAPSTSKLKKRRVCGYARVSTSNDDQANSYKTQVAYYTKFIKSHDGWEYAGMYSDEGISGVMTRNRTAFNKMMADAVAGKFDLIITKSISRFARNTVDALQNIRTLKNYKVEVYFEKENIWTLDSKVEVVLSILSCLAQDESRSISENTQWGIRKRFERGFVRFRTKNFLGYYRNENGDICINETEANVVRLIYKLFIKGMSYTKIANYLMERGIKSPCGKTKWYDSVVRNILRNERYTGDAISQKYYTVDYLQKIRKRNDGCLKKYYVENNHQAIIDRKTFQTAQSLMNINNF